MGSFEETKGKLKEAAGDLTENPELEREGSAQQDKAEAEHDAEQARAQARSEESAAQQSEREEGAAQHDK